MTTLGSALGIVAVVALNWFSSVIAQPATNMTNESNEFAGGPYCGVFCVYSALKSVGVHQQFERLVDKTYIGSIKGSTLSELTSTIRDSGAYALPLEGVNVSALRCCKCPLILHVKRPGLNAAYAHWVLFLGMSDNDQVILIDPPYELGNVPLAELLAVWDGVAIAVSRMQISEFRFWLSGLFDQVMVIAICLCVIIVIRLNRNRRRLYFALVVIGSCATISTLYNLVLADGMLRNTIACGIVANGHFKPELIKVDSNEIKQLIATNSIQLIDARSPEAFAEYHLPGAINLPVYAGITDRARIISSLPTDRRIVVYCQSKFCTWAETLASDLIHRGSVSVEVYQGGIDDWRQKSTSK